MSPYLLCEHKPILKFVLIVNGGSSCLSDELVNEPIKVLLDYTFALDSVRRKNSIQAGFGSLGLMPTVKDLHVVITNLSNLVAVKINTGNTIAVANYRSVARLPVAAVRNGGVHFLFDLTHGVVSFELKSVWHGIGGQHKRVCATPSIVTASPGRWRGCRSLRSRCRPDGSHSNRTPQRGRSRGPMPDRRRW